MQTRQLTAVARRNVASVQIILNWFRRKPLERVLLHEVYDGDVRAHVHDRW